MKRQPVKTTCKELWKYSQRVLFSVTEMHIPVFLCIGTIEYQNVNTDHTETLLPRKEPPWMLHRLYRQSQDRVELPFIQQNQSRVKLEVQNAKSTFSHNVQIFVQQIIQDSKG